MKNTGKSVVPFPGGAAGRGFLRAAGKSPSAAPRQRVAAPSRVDADATRTDDSADIER